ncbi:MAG: glucose-6-phosphate dehydrogenase, partial [Acidimicrobiia bacterium]
MEVSPTGRPRSDAMVLFGATGDLAYKKLFPALARLSERGLTEGIPIIGVASRAWDDDQLRERAREAIAASGEEYDPAAIERLVAAISYVSGDYQDQKTYQRLAERLGAGGNVHHPLFYLSIPPSLFDDVVDGLAAAGLAPGARGVPGGIGARVVVEKP